MGAPDLLRYTSARTKRRWTSIPDHLRTPGILQAQHKYDRIGIYNGMTLSDVDAICKLANITQTELATLYCYPWGNWSRFINDKYFPPSVTLNLAMLRAYVLQKLYDLKSEPILALDEIIQHRYEELKAHQDEEALCPNPS